MLGPAGAGERAVHQGPRPHGRRAGRAPARGRAPGREAALLGLRGRAPSTRRSPRRARAAGWCAGIETHVCVNQTVHDLLQYGFQVQVAADAVSSRTPANRDAGHGEDGRRRRGTTSAEMALFEMLEVAGSDEFKADLAPGQMSRALGGPGGRPRPRGRARPRAPGTALGEMVFTTGMTGYQEAVTDPSYLGPDPLLRRADDRQLRRRAGPRRERPALAGRGGHGPRRRRPRRRRADRLALVAARARGGGGRRLRHPPPGAPPARPRRHARRRLRRARPRGAAGAGARAPGARRARPGRRGGRPRAGARRRRPPGGRDRLRDEGEHRPRAGRRPAAASTWCPRAPPRPRSSAAAPTASSSRTAPATPPR